MTQWKPYNRASYIEPKQKSIKSSIARSDKDKQITEAQAVKLKSHHLLNRGSIIGIIREIMGVSVMHRQECINLYTRAKWRKLERRERPLVFLKDEEAASPGLVTQTTPSVYVKLHIQLKLHI